jgi:UDP-galactopyranose mutase
LLAQFRGQTVYLRNMMEYNIFQEELAELTNQAILDLGGRLDAYQRMFNEDVDPDLIKRRVESAAIMNEQTGSRYEDQAMARNTELLMMLILMESQVRH